MLQLKILFKAKGHRIYPLPLPVSPLSFLALLNMHSEITIFLSLGFLPELSLIIDTLTTHEMHQRQSGVHCFDHRTRRIMIHELLTTFSTPITAKLNLLERLLQASVH